MTTNEPWTDEAILRESGRWVHVPRDGVLVEEDRRLLVHLPAPWNACRVWRSRASSAEEAEDLIRETLADARAAGRSRLVWHAGDGISSTFVEDLLPDHGFRTTEELEVLAFELGYDPEPRLPRFGLAPSIATRVARDATDLRKVLRIEAAVFSGPAFSGRQVSEFMEELAKFERRRAGDPGEDPVAFRVLAFDNEPGSTRERAVASAGAQIAGETLRLWGAGTLKPYRRRGAYRALVVERCRAAQATGATLALTKANVQTSAPILAASGFRPVARERRYILDFHPSG